MAGIAFSRVVTLIRNDMKTLSLLRFVAVAGSIAAASVSFAQMGPPGSPAGVGPSLAQLFGKATSFSAECDLRTLDKDQNEKMSTPMQFAFLEGKMRVEIDMSQIKGKDVTPNASEMMKQMGMDRVISISLPDSKTKYTLFPTVQSSVKTELSEEDAVALDKMPKIVKTPLGKETIDGHPCVKNKVVITDDKGGSNEFTTWNATDLKDFPVQVQNTENGETTVMLFKNIKLSKPDAAQFAVPADYKQYDSLPAFMQAMMSRMMPDAVPKQK